jgi:hypothetical protein
VALNEKKLMEFLKNPPISEKALTANAVYDGLRTRIQQGQFDYQENEDRRE